MKKLILLALAVAALLIPATADARRGGDRGVAGTVAAYDERSGELTLALRSGRELTALVTDDTRHRCDSDDDDSSDDDGETEDSGQDSPSDLDDSDEDRGDRDDRSAGRRGRGRGSSDDDCDRDSIAVGDTVTRARIDVEDGEAYWTKLRLDN